MNRLCQRLFWLLLPGFLFLTGCSTSPWQHPPTAANQQTLYVVSHDWHTGIILPTAELLPALNFLKEDFVDGPYVEIGWGDKGFYQAPEITVKLTLKAMFWPTDSILHVVSVPEAPADYFSASKVVAVPVSQEGMAKLQQSVLATFVLDAQGHGVITQPGIYGKSYFYAAKGHYYLTNTCNRWTAQMLTEGGLPLHPWRSLTAGSVMRQVKASLKALNSTELLSVSGKTRSP
ncbi:TIGR02117 family protein [Pokkaliibacter sp. CJK22405]|uniref:TIGR02117 family protein n=1 Tax=Pokkaliibacter sp. CJK22405 TaxID=3384615 RepID=UPI0039851EF9